MVLLGTELPSSEVTMSVQTPELGREFPFHSMPCASKNSSSFVPVNTLSARTSERQEPDNGGAHWMAVSLSPPQGEEIDDKNRIL